MTSVCCSILDEFKDINFKDRRLNNRFSGIMQNLETSPSGLISKAFIDAKDQRNVASIGQFASEQLAECTGGSQRGQSLVLGKGSSTRIHSKGG